MFLSNRFKLIKCIAEALPEPAWAVLRAAQALTEQDDHVRVFPGLRPQKEGGEIGPLSTSAISMSYLPGITATPHDIRRTSRRRSSSGRSSK